MGRNKRISLVVIITIVLLIFALNAETQTTMKQEDALMKAIESSEAKISKSIITLIVRHKGTRFDRDTIEKQLNKIVKAINPDEKSVVKNIVQEIDKIRGNVLCTSHSLAYNIMLEASDEESYEIIDVTLNGSIAQIVSQKELLKNIYKEQWVNSSISMCVVGYFEGQLSNDMLNNKISAIIKALEGKKIEELQDEDLISVSAFSEKIEGGVKSRDKEINIQIAARYSSFDDKTFLWIGTPLINIEY